MSERKKAIAMISIGDRPWSKKSGATFKHYCDRIGAEFQIIDSYPSQEAFPLPDMPDSPGRKHKRAYACKAYFAWDLLENQGFSSVVVVDDTCCVSPLAPDIFAAVPAGHCGFTGTSALHAEMSFETIRKYLRARDLEDVPYRTDRYMNSGVMVYDEASRLALHKDRIVEAADLLYARYPNQTLTYYLLQRAGVPMVRMSKAFNSLPASDIPKSERKQLTDIARHLRDDIFIYHVTGSFGNRQLIVEQIATHLLAQWEAGVSEANPPERKRRGFDVTQYWEERYRAGRGSGPSGAKSVVRAKADFINRLYARFDIKSQIDFGCDDGRLMKLLDVQRFVGVDVSDTLLSGLRTQFAGDDRFKFLHLRQLDEASPCDLATSLDVVHHLVDDESYAAYIKRLFKFSTKVVCIYSSDEDAGRTAKHVRFRNFTSYVKTNHPEWRLSEIIPSTAMTERDEISGTPPFSFYVYLRAPQS